MLSPFFFVNRRKAIFDVVTGSPIFYFIRRMSPKKFFLHKTSSDQFAFFSESPKNLEISRLRRQSVENSRFRAVGRSESFASRNAAAAVFFVFVLFCFILSSASIRVDFIVLFCCVCVCVCVCVFFPFILDIKFVGRTSRGHTGERPHRISHPPSFCGACLNISREKDSAIPFPRRP